jgi:hypothetical protein
MTKHQRSDATDLLGIVKFETLPTDIWSQIPAEYATVESSLISLKETISANSQEGDYLFVQGDYGATYSMVQFAKENGLIPVYATSKRKSYEVVDGERVTTIREFEHVRFRRY